MSFVSGVSASPGVLLALREQLSFIVKGKEILEMKRDRLAGEINRLLGEVGIRSEMESRLKEAYKLLAHVLMRKGYRDLLTLAKSVGYLDLDFDTNMVMGINLVGLKVSKRVDYTVFYDPLIQALAKKLNEALDYMIKTAEVENNIESLAYELMSTSRKVNSLEKIVIPQYRETIRYVEERLMEDALGEFVRTKHILGR